MKVRYACALLLISLTIILALAMSQVAQADEKDTAVFQMTQPAPNVFRVIGLKTTGHKFDEGFGDAFEQAIKVIVTKYKIISITPITYLKYQTGGQTREILVIVDDKIK